MKHYFKKIIVSFLSLILVTSCSNPKNSRWYYTKEDAANFDTFIADLKYHNESNDLTFTVNGDSSFNAPEINHKNVVFFDKTALDRNHKQSYYSYDEIKEYTVDFTSLENNENGGFKISFNGDLFRSYGVLIHKDALKNSNFAIAFNQTNENLGSGTQIDTDFEEELISTGPSWNDAKTYLNIMGYIAQIVLGVNFSVPTATAGGIFGILSCLGDSFFGSMSPSIQDVLDKLNKIDAKLDEISAKIDENQSQIMDEFIRTQAQIDQVLVNQYKADITAFQTDYVQPIEDYMVTYKDYNEQSFKSYVNQEKPVVNFYYTPGEKEGEYVLRNAYEADVDTFQAYSLEIQNFDNSRDFLAKHNNIVGEGFAAALISDIQGSITSMDNYPVGMDKPTMAQDVYTTIVNDFQYVRYSNPTYHDEALNLMNNVRKVANRIAGISLTSAVDSYVSRLKLMFNFSGEAYPVILDLLSSLRDQLDDYLNIATMACLYAEINSTDMSNAYLAACEKIRAVRDGEKEYGQNYCYASNMNIYGNFFMSKYDASFTNLGNHPTFHSSMRTELITNFYGMYYNSRTVNLQNLGMITQNDVRRIYSRYTMLRALGYTTAETYLSYLNSVKIMPDGAIKAQSSMQSAGWIGKDSLRFLTSISVSDLGENDGNIPMTCTCKGNNDSNYFYVGWNGNYRNGDGSREEKYWSGKIARGTFLDAGDCHELSEKRICAFSRYHESHLLWFDDEIFGFVDNKDGNFYFLLYTNNL